jgi:glycosyltransferase involved in cell wall biosynthesis
VPHNANVWLVVPAYNEAKVITTTITSVRALFSNIIVVDDCSKDETGPAANGAGAYVCRHAVNLGQGAALQTGIDFALRQGATHVVTFDADGQHLASDAITLLDALVQGHCDVALATRRRAGVPTHKRALLWLATRYTQLSTGLPVTDTHNGLRAFTRGAAQRIRIRQNRMAHASEILEQIAELRLRFIEVPCTVRYTEYSRAKGQPITGAFTILADLLVRRLYR